MFSHLSKGNLEVEISPHSYKIKWNNVGDVLDHGTSIYKALSIC